jgi:hypothetical protein
MPMSTHSFQLQPFPGSIAPDISITGVVTRDRQQLKVVYIVSGDLFYNRAVIDSIQIPALNPNPTRQLELWETTCLECFIGLPEAQNYWEFNFAPNGNWNAFALIDYRKGIIEESEITSISIETSRTLSQFALSATIPLGAIVPAHATLEISITAVIQTQDQGVSYWAIAHCGREADFHRRDSFVITLDD